MRGWLICFTSDHELITNSGLFLPQLPTKKRDKIFENI